MRVHTEAVQFKVDAKLVELIESKLSKMDNYFDRIIDAKVVLKLENAGQVKDKIMEVRLNVPGEVIMASATEKTFESSLDDVLGTLKRQLIRYKDRLRKHH